MTSKEVIVLAVAWAIGGVIGEAILSQNWESELGSAFSVICFGSLLAWQMRRGA